MDVEKVKTYAVKDMNTHEDTHMKTHMQTHADTGLGAHSDMMNFINHGQTKIEILKY